MILARLARNGLALRMPLYRFAEYTHKQTAPIQYKILEVSSWKDFTTLFQKERKEFTPDILIGTLKHISTVFSKSKEHVNYSELKEIIEILESVEVENLNSRNIVSLLSLLRNFAYRGLTYNSFLKLKSRLIQRFTQLLKENENEEEISDLIVSFFEMSYFKSNYACRLISERIINNINRQPENKNIFTVSQLSFLLHTLVIKGEPTNIDLKIRQYILNSIASKINVLKLTEVMNILVDLNKIDNFDFTNNEHFALKLIGEKILEGLNELPEKSIYDFLRGEHLNKHPVISRIYEDFIKHILAEIDEHGNTEMDPDSILKMLSFVSSKYSILRHSDLTKEKILSFIKVYSEQLKSENDPEKSQNALAQLTSLVEHNYLPAKKQHEIVQCIKNIGAQPRIYLLQTLYNRKISIKDFINAFLSQSPQKHTNFKALRQGIFVNRLLKDENYQQFKEKLEIYLSALNKNIELCFASTDNFKTLMKDVNTQRKQLDCKYFHNTYGELFNKLPDPLQLEDLTNMLPYLQNYLQYVLYFFKSKDFFAYVDSHQDKILLYYPRLIQSQINKDSRQVQPNRVLLILANKLADQILEQKNKQFLNELIELLGKYNRFIVAGYEDRHFERQTFKLLHKLIKSSDVINELQLGINFNLVLQKYITRKNKNYSLEHNYKQLISHALSKLPDNKVNSLNQAIITEGVRLNLINKNNIQHVNLDLVKNFTTKAKLEYIKDETFTPSIDKVNSKTIKIILSNHNLEQYAVDNKEQILEIIRKSYLSDIAEYITSFKLPINKNTTSIYIELLNSLAESPFNLERIDFVGVMEQILSSNFLLNLSPCKKIAEKILNYLKNKIGQHSLNTHLQVLKFIITQPSLNPEDYYNALVTHVKEEYSDNEVENILFRLCFTNYQFKPDEIALIPNIIKKDPLQGLVFFLYLESKIPEENRKPMVKNIVEGLIAKDRISDLGELKYSYLKHNYPAETESVTPDQIKGLSKLKYAHRPKINIISVLEEIAKAHQIPTDSINIKLPDEGEAYRLKDWIVMFYPVRHYGAYHQHEFLKKALTQYFAQKGEKVEFICLGHTTDGGMLQYINKVAPTLLSSELEKQIFESVRSKRAAKKQEEQEPEEPVKVEE